MIEYSDNYSDASRSLWQFKRDEIPANLGNNDNKSKSFQHIVALVQKSVDGNHENRFVKNTNIVVLLKYLSVFLRSLEIPLINCKSHLELNWIENCILSSTGDSAKIKITDAKIKVRIVTLSTKDNKFDKTITRWIYKIFLLEPASNHPCKSNR